MSFIVCSHLSDITFTRLRSNNIHTIEQAKGFLEHITKSKAEISSVVGSAFRMLVTHPMFFGAPPEGGKPMDPNVKGVNEGENGVLYLQII